MSTYKMTYFNITGLGEPLRLLLHYCEVDFEDHRISFEEWPDLKPTMPMEQMPVMEIDGNLYHQTRAIGRYFAKQHNLYGSSDLEALEIDIVLDDIDDWRHWLVKYFVASDPESQEKTLEELNEKIPFYFKKFEGLVAKNGGYFSSGNQLSWADIYFSGLMEIACNRLGRNILEDYPELQKLYDKVREEPAVKAYLDSRPETDF